MENLSEVKHWEEVYESYSAKNSFGKYVTRKNFKFWFGNYSEYILWETIIKKHLPVNPELKVIEIGSAPGETLVHLHRTLGYIPFGNEYTASGAEVNRQTFTANGIDAANVIEADFFNNDFQKKYSEKFDIVCSFGFLEHFENPQEVIDLHINLLKPGGYVMVTIPNFTNCNLKIVNFFDSDVMKIHNLKIMSSEVLDSFFKNKNIDRIECRYYGTFNAGLFVTNIGGLKKILLSALQVMQLFFNITFRLIFRRKGFESKNFSPYIIFIGRKQK